MNKKVLRVNEQSSTGLNESFINERTNRRISREQAVEQIKKGNLTYEGYHVVNGKSGEFVRSNPDKSQKNNIE